MNTNNRRSNLSEAAWMLGRVVFLTHLTLELVRRVQQLGHSLKGVKTVAVRLWYSLLSLYYSLRGAMTSGSFSRA